MTDLILLSPDHVARLYIDIKNLRVSSSVSNSPNFIHSSVQGVYKQTHHTLVISALLWPVIEFAFDEDYVYRIARLFYWITLLHKIPCCTFNESKEKVNPIYINLTCSSCRMCMNILYRSNLQILLLFSILNLLILKGKKGIS